MINLFYVSSSDGHVYGKVSGQPPPPWKIPHTSSRSQKNRLFHKPFLALLHLWKLNPGRNAIFHLLKF